MPQKLFLLVFLIALAFSFGCFKTGHRADSSLGITEITLTIFPGMSKKKSYIKYTIMSDGTAIKRDLANDRVFHATMGLGTFNSISQTVHDVNYFKIVPAFALADEPQKAIGVVLDDKKKTIWFPSHEPGPLGKLINQMESSLSKIDWKGF